VTGRLAVYFAHRLTHGRYQRRWFASGAQAEIHLPDLLAFLEPGCVKQRLDFATLTVVFCVGDYANNLEFMFDVRINNMLAENSSLGEELAAEGLIDDGYFGSVRSVLRRKATPRSNGISMLEHVVFPGHLNSAVCAEFQRAGRARKLFDIGNSIAARA